MSLDLSLQPSFENMGLIESVMCVLDDIGFERPTPIQTLVIPGMLAGRDVIGQAQTGTGKTAAFAMPILSMIDPEDMRTQALVLVPTRELAIQLSDAFKQYSARMRRVSILPVYGGQDYRGQLKRLRSGAHIVVGTPGRVMDHMRRGTLKLGNLSCLVLDEADEMLQMGFIDDITWILEQTPDERQTALFSATMPLSIRRIAQQHMKEPEEIIVKLRTAAPLTIKQRYILVNHTGKVEALTRIIESEQFDGMLVFVRTKVATIELVGKLESHGYEAEALNGDIKQSLRERTVARFKSGKIDILVATDVAARGLDVDRISHVINYDIPQDTKTYIHRVGRTGRAGRRGETILFVTNRAKHMLRAIERATRQKILLMGQPSAKAINNKRIARFKENITATIRDKDLSFFSQLISEYQHENNVSALEVAAALAKQIEGNKQFLVKDTTKGKSKAAPSGPETTKKINTHNIGPHDRGNTGQSMATVVSRELFRVEVGHVHGAKPGNVVGTIASEAGIGSEYICNLRMHEKYTTLELPTGMPREIFQILKKARVGKQQLNISRITGSKKTTGKKRKATGKKRKAAKNSYR